MLTIIYILVRIEKYHQIQIVSCIYIASSNNVSFADNLTFMYLNCLLFITFPDLFHYWDNNLLFCKLMTKTCNHESLYHMTFAYISSYEPHQAKRALRVILIKIFIFLFSECTLFFKRLICDILSSIAIKISFVCSCRYGVYAASVTSWYLCNDIRNFTFVILFIYEHHMYHSVTIWC